MKFLTMVVTLMAASVIAFDDDHDHDSSLLRGHQDPRHRALNLDPKTIQTKGQNQPPLALLKVGQVVDHQLVQETKTVGGKQKVKPSVTTVTATATADSSEVKKSRRKFVAYVPSHWESVWKEGIASIESNESICQVLLGEEYHQRERLAKYMKVMCSTRYANPHGHWCVLRNDARHVIYYNLNSKDRRGDVHVDEMPAELKGFPPPVITEPIQPKAADESVFSRLIFTDEVTGEIYEEYIEPLVAHLRFPLAGCVTKEGNKTSLDPLALYQGYMMPPSSLRQHLDGRLLYFEFTGRVYKKLQYQVEQWNPDHIWVYPTALRPSVLTKSMPPEILEKTTRLQGIEVVTEPTKEEGKHFIPDFINQEAKSDDYVLWKLDAGTPEVKAAFIDTLLNDKENKYHVDEVIWVQNLERDYLFKAMLDAKTKNAKIKTASDASFHETYEKLLRLRQKGIRAHFYA